MGNADEETDEPLIADHRNFYKVEKWTRDGERVTELPFAGSNLDKAKRVFHRWAKHRPRIRVTIRQRTRVLQQWPIEKEALSTRGLKSRTRPRRGSSAQQFDGCQRHSNDITGLRV